MALSLLVLLVPVVLVVGLYRVLGGDRPPVVDTAPAIAQARAQAGFGVLVPIGLDWRASSAVYRAEEGGATLRIGYVTPGGSGVQLIESSMPADALLARELGEGPRLTGTVTVAGQDWQRYAARKDETALVRTEPGRTLIVIGHAPDEELVRLAGSLG
jgi:hypothetical protein